MNTEREICVIGRQGLRGFVAACTLTDKAEHIPVRLEDGEEIMIPANLLVARPDGGYDIPLGREDLAHVHNSADETVIPLAEERLIFSSGGMRPGLDKTN